MKTINYTHFHFLSLSGELCGKWEMSLITPDQKILRNPKDLKLYIAKSGAVVDSNIVNFALPKETAKVRNINVNKRLKTVYTLQHSKCSNYSIIKQSHVFPFNY